MPRVYKNTENKRPLPLIAWLRLTATVVLILVLAGCGTGSLVESSGQEKTGENRQSTAESEVESASETVQGQTAETAETTEQASKNDGELGTPTLGDSGAPVVMVEYSDYQ